MDRGSTRMDSSIFAMQVRSRSLGYWSRSPTVGFTCSLVLLDSEGGNGTSSAALGYGLCVQRSIRDGRLGSDETRCGTVIFPGVFMSMARTVGTALAVAEADPNGDGIAVEAGADEALAMGGRAGLPQSDTE